MIWLTFRYEAQLLNAVMTHLYSFFSHVLWPIYVPVAVLLIEPPGRRRQVLLAFVSAGLAVGVYLVVPAKFKSARNTDEWAVLIAYR